MKFMRNHWYYVGGVIFVILSFIMVLFGTDISPIQRILIASYMTMLAHQFEEYACPGGFPMFWNIGACGEKIKYDRFPLDKMGSAIVNISIWFIYITAIIFPDVIILGLAVSYMGFGQLFMHGFSINIKSKTKYNPGMATTILLMIPVGLYYIWYVVTNFEISLATWGLSFVTLAVCMFICLVLPLKIFNNPNSKYPWNKDEISRFHVEEKLGLK